MNVLGMKVSWSIGWMNLPHLNMLLEEPPPKPDPPAWWHRIPVEGGTYFVCRLDPVVRFVFESDHGRGALGREVLLGDGSTYKTNGGWSSSATQVNRLRALDSRFSEALPHDAVEVTYYGEYAKPGTYNDGWGLGMAGVAFDLPWVMEQMDEHLPGVELVDFTDRRPKGGDEHQASLEQSLIIGGVSGYGYIPVPCGWTEPFSREDLKPATDSELFLRTAMEFDLRDAEKRRQKERT